MLSGPCLGPLGHPSWRQRGVRCPSRAMPSKSCTSSLLLTDMACARESALHAGAATAARTNTWTK
eukprot:1530505-Alexandrium_andersonii.AAC.1